MIEIASSCALWLEELVPSVHSHAMRGVAAGHGNHAKTATRLRQQTQRKTKQSRTVTTTRLVRLLQLLGRRHHAVAVEAQLVEGVDQHVQLRAAQLLEMRRDPAAEVTI